MFENYKKKDTESSYVEIVKELVELETEIDELDHFKKMLYDRKRELQKELVPFVKKFGTIETPVCRLEYRQNFVKRTFQRDKTLDFIRVTFGDEIADIVDANCTIVNVSEGVWLYRKKYRKGNSENPEVVGGEFLGI